MITAAEDDEEVMLEKTTRNNIPFSQTIFDISAREPTLIFLCACPSRARGTRVPSRACSIFMFRQVKTNAM
jgi:hypothetical protein